MRRMNSISRTGVVALENEEELRREETSEAIADAEAPRLTVTEAGDSGAEEVEEELLDINDQAQELGEHEEDTAEAAETAEALESIVVALEACMDNGGLNKEAAHAVDLSLGYIYKSLGVKTQPVPALECFSSGPSSRLAATKLTMESVSETLGRLWQAIIEAIKKSITWLGELYSKIFNGAGAIKRRAKALSERATQVKGKPDAASVDSEHLAEALHLKRRTDKVKEGTKTVLEQAKLVFRESDLWHDFWSRFFAAIMGEQKSEVDKLMQNFDAEHLKKTYKLHAASGSEFKNLQPKDGVEVLCGDEMLGGQAIVIQTAGPGSPEAISSYEAGLKQLNTFANDTKLPTLTPQDAVAIALFAEDLADTVIKYDNTIKGHTRDKERMLAEVNKLAHSEAGKDGGDQARILKAISLKVSMVMDQPAVSMSLYILRTARALLEYVDLSLKQYTGGEVAGALPAPQ